MSHQLVSNKGPPTLHQTPFAPDYFLLQMVLWGENHSLLLHPDFSAETTTTLQSGCLFWAMKTALPYCAWNTRYKAGPRPSLFSLPLSFPQRSVTWRQCRAQRKSQVLWGWRQRWCSCSGSLGWPCLGCPAPRTASKRSHLEPARTTAENKTKITVTTPCWIFFFVCVEIPLKNI